MLLKSQRLKDVLDDMPKDDSISGDDDNISISSQDSRYSRDTVIISDDEDDNPNDNFCPNSSDHPPPMNTGDTVLDVCFHPKKDLIAMALGSGNVVIYKYSNEATEFLSLIHMHIQSCRDLEFSEDGCMLFSTAKDKSIRVLDFESEKLSRLYDNAHECPVYTLTVINENTLASGDDNGVVKLWDLRQGGNQPIFSLNKMNNYVSSMVTNSDGKYLVCSSGDGTLTTLDIHAQKMHVKSDVYEEQMTCLGLFKSESKILSATNRGKMYLFNWGEFIFHSGEVPSLVDSSINCLIPITESLAITGGEDGVLRATNLFPMRHLGIVDKHNFPIESIDMSRDRALIASSSSQSVKFWNVKSFHELESFIFLL